MSIPPEFLLIINGRREGTRLQGNVMPISPLSRVENVKMSRDQWQMIDWCKNCRFLIKGGSTACYIYPTGYAQWSWLQRMCMWHHALCHVYCIFLIRPKHLPHVSSLTTSYTQMMTLPVASITSKDRCHQQLQLQIWNEGCSLCT